MMRGVSVIMCCYNSEARLQETLKHLARQHIPPEISWEIVLVDNASTDHTGNLALEIWKQLIPGSSVLRVIQETRPGLQWARIKGAQEARYEILVFCDDDNWLDPDYIFQSEKTMWQNVRIAAAGGRNLPETNAENYPGWFESYKDKYAIGVPARHSGYVTQRGFVSGAGMVTRKSLFLEMYQDNFPSLLKGRKGENLNTGDDFEYCKRLLLRGWQLYYEENLKLVHFIPKERLTIDYRDRRMKDFEEAGLILNEYDLAIHVHNRYKYKDRLRLLLLTPLRIIGVRMGLVNRVLIEEELTLYYLSPFHSNKNPVRKKIKDFIYRRPFNRV